MSSRARLALAIDGALSLLALLNGLLRDASRIPAIADASASGSTPPPYWLNPFPTVIVACHVVGAVVLLGRRHRPYLVAGILAALSRVVPVISALFATYAVARYGGRLAEVIDINVGVLVATLTGADLLAQIGSTDWQAGDPYTLGLIVVTLTALGLYFRASVQLVEAERLRERAKVAVTLHDDISRQVTLMTMASAALAVTGPDEATRREAEHVRQTGEQALATLHRMIRAFSSDDVAPESTSRGPSLAMPAGGAHRALVMDALAEALLNADKHAPGAPVTIELTQPTDEVRLTVRNGAAAQQASAGPGASWGLRSLRDRSEALGGSLDAGPGEDGGWQVVMSLPTRGSDR